MIVADFRVDKKGMIRYIEEGTGAAKLRYMGDLLARLAAERRKRSALDITSKTERLCS